MKKHISNSSQTLNLDPSVLHVDPFEQEYQEHPVIEKQVAALKQGKRDFRGLDLANLEGSGLDFSHCDLRGANFFGAQLRCCNFEGADLRFANLKGANLRGANLKEADLDEVNFSDADISYVSLRGSSMKGSLWRRTKCHKTDVTSTILPDGSNFNFPLKLRGTFSIEDLNRRATKLRQQWYKFGAVITATGFFISFELLKVITPILLEVYGIGLKLMKSF